MTNVPAQRPRSLFPDLAEFFSGFPTWAQLRPTFGPNLMRLEEELSEGKYEIRAEIPGVDPAKDIDVSVHDGQLTIKAERTEKKEQTGRSEFSYGSFTRTVTLPAGADEDNVTAALDKGILTVSVPVSSQVAGPKKVQIEAPAT